MQYTYDSGFDVQQQVLYRGKEQQQKFTQKETEYLNQLLKFSDDYINQIICITNSNINEYIQNQISQEDPLSDDQYIFKHATLEAFEWLSEFNDCEQQFNIQKCLLQQIQDDVQQNNTQNKSNLHPNQTLFTKLPHYIENPLMNAQISSIEYETEIPKNCIEVKYYMNDDNIAEEVQNGRNFLIEKVAKALGKQINNNFIKLQQSYFDKYQQMYNKIQLEDIQQQVEYVDQDQLQQIVESQDLQQLYFQLHNTEKQEENILEQLCNRILNDYNDIFSADPQQVQGRNYVFNQNFPRALKGMIQMKEVAHFVYQYDQQTKISFMLPLILARILSYQNMGKFTKWITNIIQQNIQLEDLYRLSDSLLESSLKSHEDVAKFLWNDMRSNKFIQCDCQMDQQCLYQQLSKLYVRPICNCYWCNLCSFYDKTNIYDKIYPSTNLSKVQYQDQDEIKVKFCLNKHDIENDLMNGQKVILGGFIKKILSDIHKQLKIYVEIVNNSQEESIQQQNYQQNDDQSYDANDFIKNVYNFIQQIPNRLLPENDKIELFQNIISTSVIEEVEQIISLDEEQIHELQQSNAKTNMTFRTIPQTQNFLPQYYINQKAYLPQQQIKQMSCLELATHLYPINLLEQFSDKAYFGCNNLLDEVQQWQPINIKINLKQTEQNPDVDIKDKDIDKFIQSLYSLFYKPK